MSVKFLQHGYDIDTLGAILTLGVAILLLPLQLFVSSIFVRTIPLALVIGSGLYLIGNRPTTKSAESVNWRFSSFGAHVVRLTTIVGMAGMIFVGTVTGGRTVPFFVVAAIVGTLLLLQIFLHARTSLQPTTVLLQIIAFALIVRGIALVMTPGFIGVDAWVHITDYAQSIRDAGSLAAIGDVKYLGAPLYHLFVVAAAEVFQVPLRSALFLTLGIAIPLSTLLIYFLTRHFFPVRWALFAAGAFTLADHVIRWGIHLIPTSLGLVFFVCLCYLVVKIRATPNSVSLYALALLFSIATVFTHQVSTFILLLFLTVGTLSQLYFKLIRPRLGKSTEETMGQELTPSVNFAALFVMVLPLTAINWTLSPSSREMGFLETMVMVAQRAFTQADLLSTPGSTSVSFEPIRSLLVTVPIQFQLVDVVGFMLLLIIMIVGSFAVLQRNQFDSLTLTWVLSAGAMLFVTLGLPLVDLNFVLPNRWYAFLYVPMIVLGTYGLKYISRRFSGAQLMAVLVIFAVGFPGAMLVHYKATPDNPINQDYHHQYAYSQSELHAAETISSVHPNDAALSTDHPYRLLFRDWQGEETSMLNLSENRSTTDPYTVYRHSQTVDGPQVEFKSEAPRVQLPLDSVCRPDMEVVYANSDVKYCRTT